MKPELAITLRAKKLGILIKDARLTAGKTMKECGNAIGVSGSTISSYERGVSSPSLPELEYLAYFLKVPIEHFWQDQVLSAASDSLDTLEVEHSQALRHQQIGELLEETRTKLEITYDEITEQTGISYGRMKRFEGGETPIPLPELELLTNTLQLNLSELKEEESSVGKWIHAQSSISEFLELPYHLQIFVTNPLNKPYIELAQKLSSLSAEELRTIAESILEITI